MSDSELLIAAMASTASPLLRSLSFHHSRLTRASSIKDYAVKYSLAFPDTIQSGRRRLLLLLTASTALTAIERPCEAQDIPLFGLRKNLKRAEEGVEEIVKEGFEAADKGLETAERGLERAGKGIVAAEKGIEAAEEGIESAVSIGGLAQAGVVAGAEAVGVLIATAIVNGILGAEAQKS